MKINVTFYWIHVNSMFNILKIYALQHLFNVFIFGHSTCGKNTAIFFHILLQFNDRVTCYIQWSCHVSFLLYLIFFTSLILNSLNLVSLISLFQFSPTFQRTAVLTFVTFQIIALSLVFFLGHFNLDVIITTALISSMVQIPISDCLVNFLVRDHWNNSDSLYD